MTNIRPGQDSNSVLLSFEPKPDRASHRGRPTIREMRIMRSRMCLSVCLWGGGGRIRQCQRRETRRQLDVNVSFPKAPLPPPSLILLCKRQKAVTAYLKSNQLLPFDFALWHRRSPANASRRHPTSYVIL